MEGAEGGLNRSSSLKAIANMRSVYNRFLTRFPLFFGYWKKYADLEFSIAGTEAAEMVSTHHLRIWKRLLTRVDLRTRSREYPKQCRPMVELLFFQNGNESRTTSYQRVSEKKIAFVLAVD